MVEKMKSPNKRRWKKWSEQLKMGQCAHIHHFTWNLFNISNSRAITPICLNRFIKKNNLPNSPKFPKSINTSQKLVNESGNFARIQRDLKVSSEKQEILRDAVVMEMKMKRRVWSPTAHEGWFQMHRISD